MDQFGLSLIQAPRRFAQRLKRPSRPIRQLLKISAVQGAILIAAGCSSFGLEVPISATPLTISDNKTGIDNTQLCHLYKRCSLLDSTFDSCSSSDWRPKLAGPDDKPEVKAMTIARNELQNELFGESTSRCNTFKQRLVKRSTRYVLGSQSLALLLSASAAVTGGEQVAKSLAAAAGASTAFGGLMEEQFANDNDVTIAGIELARTKKFKQIIKSRTDDVLDYPVSRAVNDALRYHSVCSLVEGIAESEAAVENAINNEN